MTKFSLRSALSATTALAGGLILFAAPAAAQNLPDTGNVTSVTSGLSGGAPGSMAPVFTPAPTPTGANLRVDLRDNRTILNWGGTGFDVAAGNGVNFKDSRATGGVTGRTDNIAVLNRDLTGNGSSIYGSITSDANVGVYIVNNTGIIFGPTANVNTGAFFASTINLTNDNDFLNANPSLRFGGGLTGQFGPAVNVEGGAHIETTANSGVTGGRMGDLVLVGNAVARNNLTPVTGFTLKANGGDVAIVAASDVTILNAPGSPLSMTIHRGTDTGSYGSMLVFGDVTGRNVTVGDFAAGFRAPYGDRMEFRGSITATGAAVTDRGVVLTTGAAPGVTLSSTPGENYSDAISSRGTVGYVGTLLSAKNLYIWGDRAAVGGQFTIDGMADFFLTGGYGGDGVNAVYAPDTSLTAASVSIRGGGFNVNKVKTTGDFVFDITGGGSVWGSLDIAGNIRGTATGGLDSLGQIKAGGAITLTTGGNVYIRPFDAMIAGGKIDINSGGVVQAWRIESLTSDIVLRASRTVSAWEVFAPGLVDIQARFINGQEIRGDSGVSLIADFVSGDPTSGFIASNSITATNAGADLYLRTRNITDYAMTGDLGPLMAGRDATVVLNGPSSSLTSVTAGRNAAVNIVGSLFGSAQIQAINGIASITSTASAGGYRDITLQSLKGGAGANATGRAITITQGDGGTGDLMLKANGGNITIAANGLLTGQNVVLSTDMAFVNSAGSSAVSASGHWVIYSANPANNTFGNLDSHNTAYWNSTLATRAPGSVSGNRYVFAIQPTATISTVDFNKVYGTDLTTAGANIPFSATGLHPGVTGAFLGDTIATAFGGSPQITSAGFAPRASVAGGPYAQTLVGLGTLTSPSGYALTLGSSGNLVTVTPKALNGNVTADNKTYDGNANATGNVTLSGVVSGDTVGTTTGTFAFTDKNAGNRKTVNVSGVTLTGADSGNYTLTVPATVLADILKKALNINFTANSKTYDGTTATTGTATFAGGGVISGDDVGVTGATFAFADKNAGSGKTVNVTGVTLTGADAGNYTFTVPASLLADILKKAISGSVTANNKTYDGNINGTGTVTLTGTIQGDDVGGTAVFTFSDKNAGTGKTVSVSGATLTGADGGNYTVTLPASALADILKKALTGSVIANNKTYDGNTGATGTVTLNGVVSGDAVGTTGTVLAFADKNAGTGKTVNVSGTTLNGADAGNYTLTVPASVLADILKKALTGTVTANNKTYDGNTNATGTVTLNGVVSGDSVNGAATFTFSDKNAGTGKTVTVSGAMLNGTDAGNYTLTLPASVMADILKKAITGSVTANSKTYDGNTNGTGTVTLTGTIQGDDVGGAAVFTFSDKNAGTGKTVNVSGTTLNGADAGNYTLTIPASVIADILKKALTGTVTANNKTYDGSTAGSGTVTLNGVVSGDSVNGAATFTFADKNAGTGKTVTVGGASLSGADSGNYTVTLPASALADILKKALTGAVTANNKTYDGNTTGTGTVTLNGVVSGDSVGTAGTTFTFSDKNAGAGKTVTVNGTTLNGADSGNYTLTVPASALADILKKALSINFTANGKTYDGNTATTGTATLGGGAIAGDDVGVTGATFAFADKNAGTGKTVNVTGIALSGADAGNYTFAMPSGLVADIMKKAITGTVSVNNKTYDGTATGTGTVTLNGVVAGDTVHGGATITFSDKNAGTGKTVAISGATLSGADGGNYTVTLPATALADILKKTLTGSVTVTGRAYDGTTNATGTVALGGVVSGDTVTTSGTVLAFADKNAGTGKTVSITGTLLGGADAGNYTLTMPASALGDIARRQLTIQPDSPSKTQGDADPLLTYTITGGSLVTGDQLTGALGRAPGELPGNYAILIGTLSAGSNYDLGLLGGSLMILARLDDSAGEINALKIVTLPAQIQDLSTPGVDVTVNDDDVCGADESCTTGE
jgi:filamentous hemagglutinin family protein